MIKGKKKSRRRLSAEVANAIGLIVKPKDGERNPRYTLSEDEDIRLGMHLNPNWCGKNEVVTAEEDLPIMAAWKNGRMMSFDMWCTVYHIDRSNIARWSIIQRGGYPTYSISYKEDGADSGIDELDILRLKAELKATIKASDPYIVMPIHFKREIDLVVSDLHLGASIAAGILNPEFNLDVVAKQFEEVTNRVNSMGCQKVNVIIAGDLIESFTGLSHINSWKNLAKDAHGAGIIKIATDMIGDLLLARIANLGYIKIVGGNHCRLSSNNKEDVEAGAADIISWALGLKGFDVEFNSQVITFERGNLCYVITHGHLGLSKKPAEYVLFNYGKQGKFNVLLEGHLHSRIQKANKVDLVSSDSANYRKIVVPSLFTGNNYSEQLGFTTTAGYLILEESKSGKVDVLDCSL